MTFVNVTMEIYIQEVTHENRDVFNLIAAALWFAESRLIFLYMPGDVLQKSWSERSGRKISAMVPQFKRISVLL